jgi:predicted PurR-regulated permease PerM
MTTKNAIITQPRVAFLFLLAIAISLLLFWVIESFALPVFLAAILSGMLQPIYRRILAWTGGRQSLASALTVALSFVAGILPFLLLLGLISSQAIQISKSATDWLDAHGQDSVALQERLAAYPYLKRLLPYQDQIVEKLSEFAAMVGGWIALGLAVGVKGTAAFFLSLFVMLYATFYFLPNLRPILDVALRYTPLTSDERSRLLGTFVSVARATLKGKLIVGIVQGGLAGLSFWVAGIEGVLFWSAVMAVLSAIPSIGTALVWVPAVAFLALKGQVAAAVGVALWCALVVGTVDNVLTPRLIGKDTEMPDLLVLLTTLGGLASFGVAGILVGPIIGALFIATWQLWGGAFNEARRKNDETGE